MRTSALFGTKNVGILEIYIVAARTREKRGLGSIFRDFYGRFLLRPLMEKPLTADVFYGHWTAANI